MIWTITLIQVTALTFAATRECSAVLAEMDREDASATCCSPSVPASALRRPARARGSDDGREPSDAGRCAGR